MSSSLRDWVNDIPWMMQGVLFAAIRGCDGLSKEDPSKVVARGLRSMVLKAARLKGSFLGQHPTSEELADAMEATIAGYDKYPMHFYMHLIHAAEIVGYMCPACLQDEVGVVWKEFYECAVRALHLHPETTEELLDRLSDDPRVHENERGFNELSGRPDIKVKGDER